jgi:histone acetyltransferase (RNA polymerase elongator complex component)
LKQKHYTIPIFIPEVACPFQCIFCNQKKISGKRETPDLEEIKRIIEEHLSTINYKKHKVEIGFFGGNFTGIPFAKQENYLKTAFNYINKGFIKSIRLSTRPDYINKNVLALLKKYKVQTIELGAQSMDSQVLSLSKRGHTPFDVISASKIIKSYNFSLGIQMMIGLPGDSLKKSIHTAKQVVELRADDARIYPVLVIKGTFLEKLYQEKKYYPLNIDTAILWCKQIVEVLEKGKVSIIRIGLHPSEGILNGTDLVAGPFHQSFKQKVFTELWAEKLNLITTNSSPKKNLEISVPCHEFDYAVGYEAKNKKRLLKSFKKVSFKKDLTLKGRNFVARTCG